jgi:hypothetical protein
MVRGKIGGQKHISRFEGLLLLLVYIGYSGYLIAKVVGFVH